uniref:JmjN domain-containing protein n=1 Tax=Heterorhabditis bacteriophora TaxID=37862 RepID=A0A1I7XQ77_HETBA
MSPAISPRTGRRQRCRPLNSALTSRITDIQGPSAKTVEAMATNSSGPLIKNTNGEVSVLYAASASSKIDASKKDTLYADGREIPFPDIEGHPAHIPTGTIGFEVLTFYPTYNEFKDFNAYIAKIEAIGAHFKCGICKIVAPDGWCPRPSKKEYEYRDELVEGFRIKSPVEERIEGKNFVYTKSSRVFRKEITASNFRKLTMDAKYKNPHPELKGKDIEM